MVPSLEHDKQDMMGALAHDMILSILLLLAHEIFTFLLLQKPAF